ncbi:MAG TPA: peptide ABC transporter substrate-binding protein [Candidatus Elarobacter sp.]
MTKLATLLSIAIALLTSCAPAAQSTAGGRHPWTIPGVLRFATLGDPDTLNPLLGESQTDIDLSMFWAGYLFNWNDKNEFVPELATAVPTLANGGIAKDGRTITYHLRRGVKWQDGAPFDGDDVVWTWHAVMNPANNIQTRIGYDEITAIDQPDKYTLVVHLKRPYAPFVATFFTMSGTTYAVLPKHLLARYPNINQVPFNTKPIGTGPFIVQEWHRGDTIRMIANPHYWRGAPKLKEVRYRSIPDENTLMTAIRTHELDLWFNVSSPHYPETKNLEAVRTLLTPFTQYSRIGFNVARPIMRELAVRRAIAYATDRKHLIEVLTFGVHLLGEGDQPYVSWAHDPNLPTIPYDPAKARAVLDAAGWKPGRDGIRVKNGRRLSLEIATVSGSTTGERVSVFAQAAWKDVGIEATIHQYPVSLMLASYASGGIVQGGKFDVDFSSWIAGTDPDDATNFMCDQVPPNGQNSYRFCSHDLDAQERVALGSFDQAVRKRAYAKIQQIIVAEVPMVTMWFVRRIDIVSDDLKGYRPTSAVTPFWNVWEYEL